MKEMDKIISPLSKEPPSSYAERLGLEYTSIVNQQHKKEFGQFFTPKQVAEFMANLSDIQESTITLLDPGFGVGILTCALVEKFILNHGKKARVEIIAYETDFQIYPYANASIQYLKNWVESQDANLSYKISSKNFITDNANKTKYKKFFDIVISNPPYFKIPKDDESNLAASSIFGVQNNIYSLFMGISTDLLKPNGELIFITPRSFSSGGYFKSFREFFFNKVQLERVHLFISRKDTFNRDKVLQETLIIKATKQQIKNKKVIISSSNGLSDLNKCENREYPHDHLIDVVSNEKILYLPTNDQEDEVINIFNKWHDNLNSLNIHISTGPVVAFRAYNSIVLNEIKKGNFCPLLWLHNVTKMQVSWPINRVNKGQYIEINDFTKSSLIPNKNYVLLRRFSSKDDKSRLIAAPYYSELDFPLLGVENKLNYIYRKGGKLSEFEVTGLAALLNSRHFDTYFRIFNGNVNVSATELREIPFPPLETIIEIGKQIIMGKDFTPETIGTIVNRYFQIDYKLELL
ncbi:MAG: Eco57I restriction-modification methylase domain-containing protein [Bacteroidetes bacterium]|nr:Eco57I restriction-modification methylase domain-containing protein [Bacteroidota bacterium]